MKKLVFLTGAGVSKESGIATFRDSNDGLWNNFKIEDVATPKGWRMNKKMVLDFYNQRRKDANEKSPNNAHLKIKWLEDHFQVTVITQNVDSLHEKAGSTNVIHLHGELNKSRSTVDPNLIYDCVGDINLGDKCERGSQLRPHIIWFGENLYFDDIRKAEESSKQADIYVIIGTSMQVSPACDFPFLSGYDVPIYYVDPSDVDFNVPSWRNFNHIKKPATEGIEDLIKIIM